MAKQKVTPNGFLDFLSPEEFLKYQKDSTDAILNALGKNAVLRRSLAVGVVAADGSCTIQFTPPDGFLWEILGLKCGGGSNAQTFTWYLNNVNSAVNAISQSSSTALQLTTLPARTVAIRGGENLIAYLNTGGTVGDQFSAQVYAVEVPFAHEAQLLM